MSPCEPVLAILPKNKRYVHSCSVDASSRVNVSLSRIMERMVRLGSMDAFSI